MKSHIKVNSLENGEIKMAPSDNIKYKEIKLAASSEWLE